MKNVYYEIVEKTLLNNINKECNLKVLEIGCGRKIYKKLFKKHQYFGLDLPDSKWVNKFDKPEIDEKLSNLKKFENFNLIFAVATIYLLDMEDMKILIKLINNLKNTKGTILIFDYKKNAIDQLKDKHNNYQKILKEKFISFFKLSNIEWCSNNYFKRKLKENLNIQKSQIIEISFR